METRTDTGRGTGEPPAPTTVARADDVAPGELAAAVTLTEDEAVALAATARDARAGSTWRAYVSDLADFEAWCADRVPPVVALPAAATTVALYLQQLAAAGRSIATVRRRVAAISVAHQLAGHDEHANPTRTAQVRTTVAARGRRPTKAKALRTTGLRTLCSALEDDLTGLRDQAIILIGFAGGLRRSEIAALDVEHVVLDDGGLLIHLPRAKTDQEGKGTTVGLPYGSHRPTCPVRAYRAWVDAAAITTGPVFRDTRWNRVGATRLGDRSISEMLKRRTAAVGLTGAYRGHSMRAGFATEGYAHGVPELAVMRHGRWRSAAVMRGYVEEGRVWSDNAAARLGL